MSNRITNLCRPLRMSSTQKAVLMCIADHADADGKAWPSIPGICEWTCLSRTAVIEAMKWLEAQGWLTIEKVVGRNNRCTVNAPGVDDAPAEPVRQTDPHPSATRTGQIAEPVRQTDSPGTPDGPPPVRQADSTRPVGVPEPSINHQSTINEASEKRRAGAPAVARPDEVDQQIWDDWLQLRKGKRAVVTGTVLNEARREADKAGLTLERFLAVWCARGSQGLQAEWLKPNERGQANTAPYETAYQRSMREKVAAFAPGLARRPPGSQQTIIEMGEVRPVEMAQARLPVVPSWRSQHRGFDERDYQGGPDGSIPP